jgi:hypothetical protein
MKKRFKDLIREFARDPKAVEAETEAAPAPAGEETGPVLADGVTALVLVEFLDAVDGLTRLLNDETDAVKRGEVLTLDTFTRGKHAAMDHLDALGERMRAEKLQLSGELKTMVLERVERLEHAIAANTAGLVAMRKAVLTINRNILAALEKAASEGLYARSGMSVRPFELSVANLNAEL